MVDSEFSDDFHTLANERGQLIIEKTFQGAGIANSGRLFSSTLSRKESSCLITDLQTTLPLLAPALIEHFASRRAYKLAESAEELLGHLSHLKPRPLIGAVSNSDPRMIDVLRDLKVVPDFIKAKHVVTSWDVGYEKPDVRILEAALKRVGDGQIKSEECLFVGDDYVQ